MGKDSLTGTGRLAVKSKSLGVCVVRIQVPELHSGHRYLLNTVTMLHENVLVFIGDTEARLTTDNPLTYEMREAMLKKMYPNVHVRRIMDQPDDGAWSAALDDEIDEVLWSLSITPREARPITLYGGRDSFIQYYRGEHRTFELPPIEPVSGTEVREAVDMKDSPAFREGVIYASKHKYPTAYQCTDVALYVKGMLLVGQKKTDGGKWRFIGGFTQPTDTSLEHTAAREVSEEVGLSVGSLTYIGSTKIDDYRYRGTNDSLMSALFLATEALGMYTPGDDIDDCRWMPLDEFKENCVPEHEPLLKLLIEYLENNDAR